jgi:LysM repeat protein
MSYDLLQRKEYSMRYTRLGRGRTGVIVVLMLLISILAPMTASAAPAQSRGGNTDWAQVYTVQRGDTLSEIAWSFGVSEDAILKANSLRNANVIYVGQQLIIPEQGQSGKGGPQCADYYTVRRGDTLSHIALYRGIDEYALARANGIYDLNDVTIGQVLCIPAKGGNVQPEQPKWEPERPQTGCNPCGQPQNDGPKVDGPKNEGPQRPVEQPQRPRPEEPSCNPCGQPQNDGPKYDGPKNEGPQRPDYDGPGCSGPCGGPERPEPRKDDGPKHEPLRPTEYWKGTYFKDKYFSEFALERQDLEVNFNWMIGSPFGEMNSDRFSVRWEKVEYFKGGPYRFYAIADDGVRVYVDDQLIIDGWVIQPTTEYKADLNLGEGPHKIVVEYYEEAEDAQIRVYWEPRRHQK